MMSVTLVSSLWDLASRVPAHIREARTILRDGLPVLRLPLPMVIFVDPILVHSVSEARHGGNRLTWIVPMSFEDTPAVVRWMSKARVAKVPEGAQYRDTLPEWFCLGYNKPLLMGMVAAANPFQSSHVAWIDLGLAHAFPPGELDDTKRVVDAIEPPLSDKAHLHKLGQYDAVDFDDPEYYSRPVGERQAVAAGLVVAGVKAAQELAADFAGEVDTCLDRGRVNLDEGMLARLLHDHPERYVHCRGGYDQIISNHRQVIGC